MCKLFISLMGMCFVIQAHAFQCYFTMVKDSCWINYNLSVDMVNASTGKIITTILVPEGKAYARQAFTCQPGEVLSFQASFTPVFWEKDTGKVYPGQHYWNLPKIIKPEETAWNVTICYSNSFSGVSLPPDAVGHCECDIKSIPPVDAQ